VPSVRRHASSPSCAKTRATLLRGVTIIEFEHAAEALTALERAESRRRCRGRDALVVQPLVRPFFVIMSHERADGCPEMRPAEWHDAVQALGLDGQDKPLGKRVQIRTPRGQQEWRHAAIPQQAPKCGGVERIPVQNEIPHAAGWRRVATPHPRARAAPAREINGGTKICANSYRRTATAAALSIATDEASAYCAAVNESVFGVVAVLVSVLLFVVAVLLLDKLRVLLLNKFRESRRFEEMAGRSKTVRVFWAYLNSDRLNRTPPEKSKEPPQPHHQASNRRSSQGRSIHGCDAS
jgi:hypothetical protein